MMSARLPVVSKMNFYISFSREPPMNQALDKLGERDWMLNRNLHEMNITELNCDVIVVEGNVMGTYEV